MAESPQPEVDLILLTDEELVLRVKDYGDEAARNVLLLRHLKVTRDVIIHVAGNWLSESDLDDVLQDAELDEIVAMADYDLTQEGRSRRCSFLTFWKRRLRSRVQNSLRDRRRAQIHQTDVQVEEQLDGQVERSHLAEKNNVWSASKLGDPALLAQRHELELCLLRAIGRLDSDYRRLCEGIEAGKSLREIGEELRVSVSTVKRMRLIVNAQLRPELGDDAR